VSKIGENRPYQKFNNDVQRVLTGPNAKYLTTHVALAIMEMVSSAAERE
jgi:hypothetical protein